MKVLIRSEDCTTETTKNGNTLKKQSAALDAGDGSFPLPFRLTVNEPYKPGEYRLAGHSFKQGLFGDLQIDAYNIALVPIAQADQRKTA